MKKRERGDESQEGTFIWGWRTKTDQTRERRKTTKAAKREGRTDTVIHFGRRAAAAAAATFHQENYSVSGLSCKQRRPLIP